MHVRVFDNLSASIASMHMCTHEVSANICNVHNDVRSTRMTSAGSSDSGRSTGHILTSYTTITSR